MKIGHIYGYTSSLELHNLKEKSTRVKLEDESGQVKHEKSPRGNYI